MVKDAPANTIPTDTFVDSDNWEELQRKGLVFCTNVFDYTPYVFSWTGLEVERTRQILRWEVGEERVFEGWAFLKGEPTPPEDPQPHHDVGFYILPPAEGWTDPWERMLDPAYPQITEAGISSLFDPSDDLFEYLKPHWDIWTVYGSEDQFRCWGPSVDPDSKHEGTLQEVIEHIKAYVANSPEDAEN